MYVLPWQVTMYQLIYASLSHTHYWYEVGMLKVPAVQSTTYMLYKARSTQISTILFITVVTVLFPASFFHELTIHARKSCTFCTLLYGLISWCVKNWSASPMHDIASRPSEHPPVRGKNVKSFRWNHRLQRQNLLEVCICLSICLHRSLGAMQP